MTSTEKKKNKLGISIDLHLFESNNRKKKKKVKQLKNTGVHVFMGNRPKREITDERYVN